MRAVVLGALVTLLCACSHTPHRPLNDGERQAIKSAEVFILRHGHTVAGHPANLPVENAEVLDPIASREELVQWRRGTLEQKAFGVAELEDNLYYVFFHRTADNREFRAVLVQDTEAVQVVHSLLRLEGFSWVPNVR